MIHHDEPGASSPLTRAKRAKYLEDPDALIVRYEGLAQRAKRMEAQIAQTQPQLAEARRRLAEVSATNDQLAADVERLKSLVSHLRTSTSMKVGKFATAPLRAGKKYYHQSRQGQDVEETKPQSAPAVAPKKATAANVPPRAVAERSGSNEIQVEQLRANYIESGLPSDLLRLVSFLYYSAGDITEANRHLESAQLAPASLSVKERRLVNAVTSRARIQAKGLRLPPKQSNPVYLAERDRVMYCVHSVEPYNSNGYSTRSTGMIKGMLSAGLDVVVAARPGYPWDARTDTPPLQSETYVVERLGAEHYFSSGPNLLENGLDHYIQLAADKYVQVALKKRVSRIIAASNHITALPALIAARRLGIPFSYEVRGLWEITESSTRAGFATTDRFLQARTLETLVAANADVVFAINEQVREELVARGVALESIELLPNAVDPDQFSPLPPHLETFKRLGLKKEQFVVGYAGSMVHYEGLDVLLRAMCHLSDTAAIRVVLVGDGAAASELKQLARDLGVSDKVDFVGRVAAERIPEYISCFDAVICPRRSLEVTNMVTPLKPLEAMAAGRPVIASDLPPLRALVGDSGARGFLFSPDDPESLAKCILHVAENEELSSTAARRARKWIVERRTWNQAGVSVSTTPHSVLDRNAPSLSLRDVTVGFIADPFTLESLTPECNAVILTPGAWRSEIETNPIDALFVESAWEGVDGLWRQKVGYYDESRFSALRTLIEYCRENEIPTIFWNKEDPVHFNRFIETAIHFDHIFSTDDGSLEEYLKRSTSQVRSVASLPFYAQPRLHNPILGDRPYSHKVAYAGSYYGSRYQKRSNELRSLLTASRNHGLTIYDRQHLNPQSPYKFPEDLSAYVAGGLEYGEMVQAYRSHPVHINVNSVSESSTMFSRRVMEIAASGNPVVSGPGRAIQWMFNGAVPVVTKGGEAEILIDHWMHHERDRNLDAWIALRTVTRAHTAAGRLAYVLRTAGLEVSAPEFPAYSVIMGHLTKRGVEVLNSQTVPPSVVLYRTKGDDAGHLNEMFVEASGDLVSRVETPFYCELSDNAIDRTYFEDVLSSLSYVEWDSAVIDETDVDSTGHGLVERGSIEIEGAVIKRMRPQTSQVGVRLRRSIVRGTGSTKAPAAIDGPITKKTILFAGHDFKFARGLMSKLASDGHTIIVDEWAGHGQHNEELSQSLLGQADLIFCEWTLGNAAWYSRNKRPDQRIVARLHSQELFSPHLAKVNFSAIDRIIFVGDHIRRIALRDYEIGADRSLVIPNPVAVARLRKPKTDEAKFTLGLVGIVPAQKGLHHALDLLERLRSKDSRYNLHIKGKRPEDFPWMAQRPDEMAYYDAQFARIEQSPLLTGAVTFDAHGNDMPEWYRGIGIVLSVSRFESFHLTLADGAASGALPLSLAWPGADRIYPPSWLHASVEDMSREILSLGTGERYRVAVKEAVAFVADNFEETAILDRLARAVLGSNG
ncbi:glycosyltransferase [uncultured Arthrobacter sp.]|uniref:glycosyltransferase n=1 Tax=uncultured Arthrobacter sp. TaxID=114050 RepID=UPI0026257DFD|nr:glycosyltransferase [uncultured Arthrobacter sp.]